MTGSTREHRRSTGTTRRREPTWRERPSRELFRLAWPICISLLSYTAMTLTDTIFVGRIGTAELAGVGLGGVLAFTVLCFPMGLLRGVRVVLAQARGAEAWHRVLPTLAAGLLLATGLGVVAMAFFALQSFVVPRVLAGSAAAGHASTYLLVRGLGAPLFLWAVAFKEVRYGLSDSRSPMVAALVANVANIGLDALFLVGLRFGVEGAALASVLAQGVEAALLLGVQARFGLTLRSNWPTVKAVLKLGIPSGLQMWVEVSAFAVLTGLLASRSDLDVAAHQIALQLEHVAFLPALAVAEAAGIMAGEAVGAGRLRWVLGIALRALGMTAVYGALCAGVFVLFGRDLVGVFTEEAQLTDAAGTLLLLAALFTIVDGAQVVARGVLRGSGDVKVPAFLAVTCAWVMTPPLTWLFAIHLDRGAPGAWTALTLEIFLISGVLWVRLRSGWWWRPARLARRLTTA